MNPKNFCYFSIILLFFSFLTVEISAQRGLISCLPNNSHDAPYWDSSAVFTGLAEKLSVTGEEVAVKFWIEKAYRGIEGQKSIEIVTNSKDGYGFEEGRRYFVYAYNGNEDKLRVHLCSRTIPLENAADDIEYAEEVAAGKSGTRIYGYVHEDRRESFWDQRRTVPLAGLEVTIQNKTRTYTTRTDEKGKYVFKEIPAGVYQVKTENPRNLRELKFLNFFPVREGEVLIGEDYQDTFSNTKKTIYRHWDSKNFVFTSQGAIKGQIAGFEGGAAPQQFLWLLALDEKGRALFDDPVEYLWTNKETGEFSFRTVPPGKYLLVINRYGCHDHYSPQNRRTFFPGAAEQSGARIISVSPSEEVKLDTFRLLPPLKEKWFSGTVYTAEKTPLAGASVVMWNQNWNGPNECFNTVAETQTDEKGQFRVKGYEGYQYKIRAFWEIKDTEQPASRLYSKMFEIPPENQTKEINLVVDSDY